MPKFNVFPASIPVPAHSSSGWRQEFLSWGLISIPLVIFVWTLYGMIPKAPFVDDFDAILNFFIQFEDEPSYIGKLKHLFAQHNEHRITVTRFLSVLLYATRGSIEFDVLNCIGIAFLVAFTILVYSSFKRNHTPVVATLVSLPFFLLVFQPQPLECLVWSTVVVANSAVLLFAGLTFWFLASSYRWRLPLALIVTALALFSQGNGLAIFPAVSILLLLKGQYRDLFIWGAGCLVLIALYFIGYAPNPHHPSALAALPEVSRNFLYTLYFIGSGPHFGDQTAALWWGISAYVAFLALFIAGSYRENSVVFGLTLFLFGSIWINALSRSEFGVTYALGQNRYGLYSVVTLGLLASGLSGLVGRLPKTYALPFRTALISGAVLFSFWSYKYHTEALHQHNQRLRAGMREWAQTGVGFAYPWVNRDRANAIMEESLKRHIYVLPPRLERIWRRRVSDS